MNTSYLMIPDSCAQTSGMFVSVLHVSALCGTLRLLSLQPNCGSLRRYKQMIEGPVKTADGDTGDVLRSLK